MLQLCKLTSKYQTTVPRHVREILGLSRGDFVVFEIDDHRHVHVRKALPSDVQFLKGLEATLTEWQSQHDDEAYRGL
jgi:bifunctional DNA-binding transcriptional regulator/antitoxin component of YhaV-PrlF toxin-antitoxin module